jgi:hypothetical protein
MKEVFTIVTILTSSTICIASKVKSMILNKNYLTMLKKPNLKTSYTVNLKWFLTSLV